MNTDRIRRFPALLCFTAIAFGTFGVATPDAAAQPLDVDGRWTGRTTCPLGVVDFVIDLQGDSGTFSHGGFGPERQHPQRFAVKLGVTDGWEGQWLYFGSQNPDDRAGFVGLSGLLSPDHRNLEVRPSVGLGDCQGFVLTRDSAAGSATMAAEETPTGSPANREPSASEMRQAVEDSLHGGGDGLEINNPLNGAKLSITRFDKLACIQAMGRPGYTCDYTLAMDMDFHSNEGTAAGRDHARAVGQLWDYVNGMSNAPSETANTSRFLYVKARGRWVKLED